VYDQAGVVLVAGLIRDFAGIEGQGQDLGHEITRMGTKTPRKEFV
jgi:hypothetical protein